MDKKPISPINVLNDYLESLKMTKLELASKSGLDEKIIEDLFLGKISISSPNIANGLEIAFGRPSHFWINLEIQGGKKTKNDICLRKKGILF